VIAAVSNMFNGYNWYDAVVPVVLAYGVWNGWEAPFTEKIFGVAEMTLALVVGIAWYGPVSARLESVTGMTAVAARPAAFIGIAILVRLLSLLAQHLARRKLANIRFGRRVDLIGSPLAGFLWACGLMIWITVALNLTNSRFFHDQIARNSRFGAMVIARVPAVAITLTEHSPEQSSPSISLKLKEDLDSSEPDVDM
jgi:hypothetical protein